MLVYVLTNFIKPTNIAIDETPSFRSSKNYAQILQKQNAFKFFYNFVKLNNVHNYNTRQKIYSAYS